MVGADVEPTDVVPHDDDDVRFFIGLFASFRGRWLAATGLRQFPRPPAGLGQ